MPNIADNAFLKFTGLRFNHRDCATPQPAEVIERHDDVIHERDEVLKALIDTQRKLQAAVALVQHQDRMQAQQDVSSYKKKDEWSGNEPWLGYRWFVKDTETYSWDLGFYSRGRPEEKVYDQVWNGNMVVQHIEGFYTDPPSFYLSVVDSPARVLATSVVSNQPDYEVAVIDLHKLQRSGHSLKRTTSLLKELGRNSPVQYATFSRILVYLSIPPSCILGFLSREAFEAVCESQQVCDKSQTWHDFEKLSPDEALHLRSRARFGQSLYYQVPKGPPPRRYRIRLASKTRSSGEIEEEVSSARDSHVLIHDASKTLRRPTGQIFSIT
ncbi:hypothetical protein H2198_008021 [Neophaeococcomyces mojaviensis]|uniref:Uncharacterized protein n=1 Tax=Neophaeococcomyces mojaviensis TaxID=3383035 RepID=A0ACC2ZYR3_9EURO|nr:hypothetical protein H2198_008021 [Knufia sp. JES_112]